MTMIVIDFVGYRQQRHVPLLSNEWFTRRTNFIIVLLKSSTRMSRITLAILYEGVQTPETFNIP